MRGQSSQPTRQTPTFRTEIEYVEVDVGVTDGSGRFVRELTRDDFQVLEDGRPQTISGFTLVDLPVQRDDRPLYATDRIEPDIASNERPFDGRIFVMVIDDLHTGFTREKQAKAIAREFIEEHLGANDLMAVVHTVGASDAQQEFTSNKRLLLAAVDRTRGRKLRSATVNKVEDFFLKRRLGVNELPVDDDDAQRAQNARATMRVLEDASRRVAAMRGRRKAILFLSEGIDYDVRDVMSTEPTNTNHSGVQDVLAAVRDAVSVAARANVLVYGIDPRGVSGLHDEDIQLMGLPDEARNLGIDSGSLRNELRMAQDSLHKLSAETGGFAVTSSAGFAAAFDRIIADNSSYYLLAYYPSSNKRDGRFHAIDVRVNRPGVTIRARRGYTAARDAALAPRPTHELFKNASVEVVDTLNGLLPVSNGLRMRVTAAAFRDAAPNASILVTTEIPGQDLDVDPASRVELLYIAVDTDGKIRGAGSDRLILDLRPEIRDRVQQNGVRFLNRLRLPAGRYQVRVAARQASTATGGGATGSVVYDLEVPDYERLPLSMSGVLLTSAVGASTMTARPDQALRSVLPAPPVARRTFPSGDEMAVFAEVYDMESTVPHRVDIAATVTTNAGTVMMKTEQERSSSELRGAAGGYGFTARLPLAGVAPGAYVLTVEARSRLSGNPSVRRDIRFTVTPRNQ